MTIPRKATFLLRSPTALPTERSWSRSVLSSTAWCPTTVCMTTTSRVPTDQTISRPLLSLEDDVFASPERFERDDHLFVSTLRQRGRITILRAELAYGSGFGFVFFPHASGADGRHELPLVLHFLRDSTLAL